MQIQMNTECQFKILVVESWKLIKVKSNYMNDRIAKTETRLIDW